MSSFSGCRVEEGEGLGAIVCRWLATENNRAAHIEMRQEGIRRRRKKRECLAISDNDHIT
jgi:hypothetical protein